MADACVKEVILENFMSYEYARIPLKTGLNIIAGPNGAGKSSIVLAMAVALGQTYTERSRRLRDLIRRGKDVARVTVVFDNKPDNGKRPIPFSRKDELRISRYLKADGSYWFQMDFKTVDKMEVVYWLSKLGVNPNNLLIIMHQNMIEAFSQISPQERLALVEEAAGLHQYRERIVEARQSLGKIVSEEESVAQLLSRSEETLGYWKEQYEKLKLRRQLQQQLDSLRVELAWARYLKQSRSVEGVRAKISEKRAEIEKRKLRLKRSGEEVERANEAMRAAWKQLEDAFLELSVSERSLGRVETSEQAGSRDRLKEAITAVEKDRGEVESLKSGFFSKQTELIDSSIKKALIEFRVELLERELRQLERKLSEAEEVLKQLEEGASKLGPMVETDRSPDEALDDIKFVSVRMAGLGELSDEVERMYFNYLETMEELKERAKKLAENKAAAMTELQERTRLWKGKIRALVRELTKTYREVLSDVDAKGEVRIIDLEDPEEAGLQLLVGYRGSSPTILDPFTQSGGERTTATMSFLLALQQHIKSPIRVVDEFDIHLDPLNRERMMARFLDIMRRAAGQTVFVTPRRIVGVEEGANIIVVQNVAGASRADEVV